MWSKALHTGSGWDRVNFLHSNQYGAVFRVVTKTVLITQQCFHYCWAVLADHQGFLFFWLFPLSTTRLGVGKKLEGNTGRTADLNWPKGFSMLDDNILNVKNCREGFLGKQPLLREWLGIGLLVRGGEWLPLHHLFCFYLCLCFTY